MLRLFIGFPLPRAVAEPLARSASERLGDVAGARVYPARDLHLTLCFIAEFPEGGVARLAGALTDETRGLRAPELRLAGVATFPPDGWPRVVYAGVGEEPGTEGRLDALRNRAENAALGAGWRIPSADRARRFHPHVTLARVRPARAGAAAAGTDGWRERALAWQPRGAWIVTDVALMRSDPEDPAARFTSVAEAPLLVRPG